MKSIGAPMPMDICCLNWKGLFAYLRKWYGQEGVNKVAEGLVDNNKYLVADKTDPSLVRPITIHDLEDSSYWVSNEFSLQILANVNKVVPYHDPLRVAGEAAVLGRLSKRELFISRIVGPMTLAKKATKLNSLFNNTKTVQLAELARGRAVYQLRYHHGYEVTKDVCNWNLGIYIGMVKACGCRVTDAKETRCVKNGDEYCEFDITWAQPKLYQRVSQWILFNSIKEVLNEYENILDERNKLISRLIQEGSDRQKAEREAAGLAAIVASSRESIIGVDLSGTITSWNQAAAQLYGYGPAEAVGRHISMLIPEAHPDRSAKIWGEVLAGGKVQQYETVRLTKDGRLVDVSLTISPLMDESGNPVGIAGISQDITQRKRAEEALRQSEETFRLAFHTSPDAIAITRAGDGRYLDVNQGFTDISGYTREELLGKTSLDINIWADPRDRQRLVDGLRADSRVTNLEATFLLKDGREVPALMSAAIFTINGDPHIYSTTKVIEDQKRAEKALRESEERYRLLVESANEGIVVAQDGMIKFFNTRMLSLTGMSAQDYTDRPFIEHVHPDDRAKVLGHHQRRLQGDPTPNTEPFRIIDTRGRIKWLLPNGVLIAWEGRPATLAFFTDITERKQAEEALRESEERFRVISEESPLGISLLDHKGRIEYVNPAFTGMFGYTLEDAPTGEAWFQLVYPDSEYRQRVKNSWSEDLENYPAGAPRPRTYEVRCKDGGRKTILFRPVTIAGGRQFIIYEDISERLEAERQLRRLQEQLFQSQKLEALGVLAGGIAHDFNNVLQAISGYTQLILAEARVSGEDQERLELIGEYIARASGMIGQLMTLARKSQTRLERVDLNWDVTRTVKMLEHTLPRMIKIKTQLAPDLLPIKADPTQIEQVLLNLSANASQAMPQGGELTFVTRNLAPDEQETRIEAGLGPGDYVGLEVSDTGIGMDEETRSHIFEPFFTTKPHGKGTGLGLSTVYGIVTNFGGSILCRSQPGRGTSFTIYMPSAKGLVSAAPPPPEPSFVAVTGKETILVVDDEEAILDTCRQALEMLGYVVLTAASGEEALGIYQGSPQKVSLVILDLNMPGMGGRECLARLREAEPQAQVLVATGYADETVKEEIIAAGALSIIGKPYKFSDLVAAVRSVLDER